MKKIISTILLTAFCTFNFFAQITTIKEEYAIYAAVLENIYAENFKHNEYKTSFVISENTIKSDFVPLGFIKPKSVLDYANDKVQSRLENLLTDFRERNEYSTNLEKQFPTKYQYNLITKDEIEYLLEQGKKEYKETLKKCKCLFFDGGFAFQPLYKKYPNSYGYYNFSRIGFGSDRTVALVFANKVSGDQGSATFYILEKMNDKWMVSEKIFAGSWIY